MFKKGMPVIRVLHGAGVVSQENSIVLKVDKRGVWLDNGNGNDPSGPFVKGVKEGCFGFWEEIRPTPLAPDRAKSARKSKPSASKRSKSGAAGKA